MPDSTSVQLVVDNNTRMSPEDLQCCMSGCSHCVLNVEGAPVFSGDPEDMIRRARERTAAEALIVKDASFPQR